MSQKGLQAANTWRCICGRQVPARMEECHCGITREQALQAAKADQPEPRKPLTLLAVSLRIGAVAAVVVVGVAFGLVYLPSTPRPIAASPPATPRPEPTPVAVATAATVDTMPPWEPNLPNYEAPPPVFATPVPPPPETMPTPDEPSELDKLKARAEFWRGRYQPAAARVAQLEKDLVALEADVTRAGSVPYEDNNPGKNAETKRRSDFFKDRLDAARKELAAAREELSQIEEAARREGVPSGQLY